MADGSADVALWHAQRAEVLAGNMTLLVSHFEVGHGQVPPQHYGEIDRAIALNLLVPQLGEVIVLLDSARQASSRAGSSCARLTARLITHAGDAAVRKLKCVDCGSARPTYQDLFVYASSRQSHLHGRLVVLANADVVLDSSLVQLPPTPLGHVHTLTVNTNRECRWKRQPSAWWRRLVSLGAPQPFLVDGLPISLSWDAYAFRSPLPIILRANATTTAFGTTKEGPLFMNSFRAENRAACALAVAGVQLHSACLLVRLRHLHSAQKTHGAAAAFPTDACEEAMEGRARPKGQAARAVGGGRGQAASSSPSAADDGGAHHRGEGWPCEYYNAPPLRQSDPAYTYVVDASVCSSGYGALAGMPGAWLVVTLSLVAVGLLRRARLCAQHGRSR